jgi:hypothetical protein
MRDHIEAKHVNRVQHQNEKGKEGKEKEDEDQAS